VTYPVVIAFDPETEGYLRPGELRQVMQAAGMTSASLL
jgi:hypothetical protein